MTLDLISFLTGSDHDTERSRFDNQRSRDAFQMFGRKKKNKTTKIGREIERKENCPTNLTEFLRKTINFVGTSPFSLVSTENSCRKAGGEFSLNKSRDFAMISIAENCRIHVLWIFIEVCYVEDIF